MSRFGELGGKLYRGEVSYDFVGNRKRWYAISAVILLLSIGALIGRQLTLGIEFEGGAVFIVPTSQGTVSEAEDAVVETGVTGEVIVTEQTGSSGRSLRIQTETLTNDESKAVAQSLAETFDVSVDQITAQIVGPSWGQEITQKALRGLIYFLVLVVIFLSVYFEWRMAVAALIALGHDLIITVGIYALVGFTVTPATIIGVLTILGYSLYDTVVVFDKVKENTRGLAGSSKSTYSEAANLALNQTLVRSINTSIIALLPVTAILVVGVVFLGAGTLKDLALALFIGIAAGTYSSIFIATPLLAQLKEHDPQMKALAKRVEAKRSASARVASGKSPDSGSTVGKTATAVIPELDLDVDLDDIETPEVDAPASTATGTRNQPKRKGGGNRPGGEEAAVILPADVEAMLRERIRDVPDWPTPGVVFKDIAPLLADHTAFKAVIDALCAGHAPGELDQVAGVEARGFVLGAPVAYAYGAGFVPVRKAGKLPGITATSSYDLEYGSATIEVQADAFAPGDRVLIIDDVLATGGTAAATVDLVHRAGATVVEVKVLIELGFLGGRSRLPGIPVTALLQM